MAHRNLNELEELLKLAEASNAELVELKNTDVNKYIKHFNIKAGKDFVRTYIVYYHYRQWRKTNNMSRLKFLKQFNYIFKKEKKNNEFGYYLDSEPFDITIEGYFKARAFLRRERSAKEKRKKSKS